MSRLKLCGVFVLALLAVAAVTAQEPTGSSVELGYSGVTPRRDAAGLVLTLRDVRVVAGGVVIEAEAADLSRVNGRLQLALPGGGTIKLPEGPNIRLVGRDGGKPRYDFELLLMLKLR